jgi:hypothetical protein
MLRLLAGLTAGAVAAAGVLVVAFGLALLPREDAHVVGVVLMMGLFAASNGRLATNVRHASTTGLVVAWMMPLACSGRLDPPTTA